MEHPIAIFPGDSQMAARMRAFDWSCSPIGPPATWPATLHVAMRMTLGAAMPMAVWWGGALTLLYNDSYGALLGVQHPSAFGQPGRHLLDHERSLRLFATSLIGENGLLEGTLGVYRHRNSERAERDAQLNDLFTRLVTVQEDERRRMSRDIHDHLGQQLTALRMSLEALASQSIADPTLLAYAARAQRIAADVDETVDFLAWELRPAELEREGLAAALSSLARGWSVRSQTGVHFETADVESIRLSAAVEANVYRLAQEALHNVFKHAHANRVSVFLGRFQNHLMLIIDDDGRGFSLEQSGGGLGLDGMRERASLVGAELHIEAEPGRGTSVLLRLPIPDPESGLA